MALNKTSLKKYITIIKNSKKKVLTCEDVSLISGERVDVIKEHLSNYSPLLRFDSSINIKDILPFLEEDYKKLNVLPKKKRKTIKKKDFENYNNTLDYIYKKMTIAGGMLNLGYTITIEDIKILRKLLKNEENQIKKK